jgi:hypothetical protein
MPVFGVAASAKTCALPAVSGSARHLVETVFLASDASHRVPRRWPQNVAIASRQLFVNFSVPQPSICSGPAKRKGPVTRAFACGPGWTMCEPLAAPCGTAEGSLWICGVTPPPPIRSLERRYARPRPMEAPLRHAQSPRILRRMLRDAQGCPVTTSLASWAFASSYISSEGVFMPNQTVTFRSWSPTIVSTRHLETCGAG